MSKLPFELLLALPDAFIPTAIRPPVKAVEIPKTQPPARPVKPVAKVAAGPAKSGGKKIGAAVIPAVKASAGKARNGGTTSAKPGTAKSKPSPASKTRGGPPRAKTATKQADRAKTTGKAK